MQSTRWLLYLYTVTPLWPTGGSQPGVSTLNAWDAALTANAALVPTGTSSAINAYVTDPTHLILDLNGYFAP